MVACIGEGCLCCQSCCSCGENVIHEPELLWLDRGLAVKGTFQVDQPLATIEMVLANASLRTLQQIALDVAQPSGYPQWQQIAVPAFPAGNRHQPFAIRFGEQGFEVVQQGAQDPFAMGPLELQQAATECTVVSPQCPPGQGMEASASSAGKLEIVPTGWTEPEAEPGVGEGVTAQRADRLNQQCLADFNQSTQLCWRRFA